MKNLITVILMAAALVPVNGQVKLSQLERCNTKFSIPVAARTILGVPDYVLQYMPFNTLMDSLNFATPDSTIILAGTGISVTESPNNTFTVTNTQPPADGSETKVNAGTGISVTGTGTTGSPYIVTNTQPAGLTGSGVATRVAFWDSGTSLSSNSNLFWDNVNNELEIKSIPIGSNATNQLYAGYNAGYGATNATSSNFFGGSAGYGATDAQYSNFLGYYAGYQATAAPNSNFFGTSAGSEATSASASNFFGYYAGYQATAAPNSNFFGNRAGSGATSAQYSNFLGYYAGYQATAAPNSNFFGNRAGYGAINGAFSNVFGANAATNNIGSHNIIIGSGITLADGTSRAMNLGGVLFGTNIANYTSGGNTSPVTGGKIGIMTASPQRELHVTGEARITDLTTDTPTAIVGADADGDLGSIAIGTGLTLSAGTLTATATPADGSETKVNAGTGIIVTGTGTTGSPYIVTNTGDLSDTNEAQAWTNAGTSSYTGTLATAGGAGGGSFTIQAGTGTAISHNAGTVTISATTTPDSTIIAAGTGISVTESPNNTFTITNTQPPADGSETKVNAGTGISVTGTGTTGSPYIVTNTGDLSATNEAQAWTNAGTSSYTGTLATAGGAGGGSFTLQAGTGTAISHNAGTVTISATTTPDSTIIAGGTGISVTESPNNTFTITNTQPAGLTGSGVATRVAFWDSGTSLSSNSNLFWDNVNNRLGIGNATPSFTFDLNGGNIAAANNAAMAGRFAAANTSAAGSIGLSINNTATPAANQGTALTLHTGSGTHNASGSTSWMITQNGLSSTSSELRFLRKQGGQTIYSEILNLTNKIKCPYNSGAGAGTGANSLLVADNNGNFENLYGPVGSGSGQVPTWDGTKFSLQSPTSYSSWLLAASGTAGTQSITNGATATINGSNGLTATRSAGTVSINLPSGTSGQVLKHNGTAWAAGTDNTGYTTITAGTGITVNTSGSNVTITNAGDTDLTNEGYTTTDLATSTQFRIKGAYLQSGTFLTPTQTGITLNAGTGITFSGGTMGNTSSAGGSITINAASVTNYGHIRFAGGFQSMFTGQYQPINLAGGTTLSGGSGITPTPSSNYISVSAAGTYEISYSFFISSHAAGNLATGIGTSTTTVLTDCSMVQVVPQTSNFPVQGFVVVSVAAASNFYLNISPPTNGTSAINNIHFLVKKL